MTWETSSSIPITTAKAHSSLSEVNIRPGTGSHRTCRAVRPAGKSAPEAWLHNNYAFTNAPLEDVVEFLERHYAVEIEVADARILQYSYTMEFYNETIDEVLSVMSQITPIRYSRVNDRITVQAAR